MNSERAILGRAAALLDDGTPFVLVTVAGTQGSSPRAAGAKMIWRPSREPTGEIEGSMTIHYEHAVQAPDYNKTAFVQPFAFTGTAVNAAYGYVPVVDIQGWPLGYSGYSDYTYLVRPHGAIRVTDGVAVSDPAFCQACGL